MKYSLIILVIAMTFGFISCKKEETPKTEPLYHLKDQPKVAPFDGGNAYQMVSKQVSFGPRNPNSLAHQAALSFFTLELKKYADTVVLQNFTYQGYNNEQLNLTNVIAKFNPKATNRIFISAHWDCRPRAEQDKDPAKKNQPIPGANDGASGAGILLEIARMLKSNPVNYGIDLVFFDGEDYGKEGDIGNYFLGSKYFAAQKSSDYRPAFGILLDLVGDKEAVFAKEGLSMLYAPDVTNMIWNLAKKVNSTAFNDVEGNQIQDDHLPLNEAGLSTVDIIDIDLVGASTPNPRRNYWHTHNDTMENISKDMLQQVGNVLSQLIYSLEFSKPSA
ncbi:MAG: M28 family peptidase [Bacteroidota bacterium]|nr:M28 family peptidase [Bacteroidota bacterium]